METFKSIFEKFTSLLKLLMILVPVVFMFSCTSDDIMLKPEALVDNDNPLVAYDPLESMNYVSYVIGQNNLYGNGIEGFLEENIVIRDEYSWVRLLYQMNLYSNISESISETDINFNGYQVIAVFDQLYDSTNHKIDLEFDWNSENVTVGIIKSRKKGAEIKIMTQPFQIVKIPKTNLPVEFHNRIPK